MIDLLEAYEVFKGPLGEEGARRLIDLLAEMREEMIKTIVSEELSGLRNAVDQLAEAQRRTEERLETLTMRVDRLAEAQAKTEERLNQLAEAQKRTEEKLEALTVRVDRLAEAQTRTEERLNQLAEAQARTEERLNQLAEAQRKTEEKIDQMGMRMDQLTEEMRRLAEAQRQAEEQIRKLTEAQMRTERRIDHLSDRVEGISHTVGYTLEDKAIRSLPPLLERDHNIKLTERLVRRYVTLPRGKSRQVNIYGRGKRNGTDILVLGECKVRASKKEVRDFLRLADRIEKYEGIETFRIFVCYDFTPEVEDLLKQLGVSYYWSYELD